MKSLKKSLFLLIFILSTIFAKAQTSYSNGCYVAAEGRVYILINSVCRIGLQNCDPALSSNYIVITRRTTTSCTTCQTSAQAGVLVDFNVFPCPLDNYLFGLLIPIGFLGFQYLRRTA